METVKNFALNFLNLFFQIINSDSFFNSAMYTLGVCLAIVMLHFSWDFFKWELAPLLKFKRGQQYVYRRIEKLYYVGTYTLKDEWQEESRWNTLKEAKERANYLCEIAKKP